MATFDSALNRLEDRMATLNAKVITEFEGKATAIYSRNMPLASNNDWRIKRQVEYLPLSKELKLHSHKLINIRRKIDSFDLKLNRTKCYSLATTPKY
jgi:hypothetical protein